MKNKKIIEKTIHQDIFYPSNQEKIYELINENEIKYKSEIKSDKKVFLLPHASYEFILPLLINTFTSINDSFDKIVIIAPSHLNKIYTDLDVNLFTPEYDAIETPLGLIDFDKEIIDKYFKDEMKCNTYFEEESSFEQLYLLIRHYFSEKKVIPICAIVENSNQSKNFSSLLNNIIDEKTLLLVSANACAYQKPDSAYKKTNNFIKALNSGERLLQLQKKNIIDSCACGIIDSIAKTKIYKNLCWDINLVEIEKEISKEVIEFDSTNKCVYHVSASIKD